MKHPPEKQKSTPRYRTYLLTCWQERDNVAGTVTWRFKLETPGTGEKRAFALLKDTMAWIESELHHDAQSTG
jgi:hypothetical protein